MNNLQLIEKLSNSDDTNDLLQLRQIARSEITEITEEISELFIKRQKIMGLIATSKKKSEAILQLDREYELLIKFGEKANSMGEDSEIMKMLIWFLTAAGKNKQQKILERSSVFVKEDIHIDILKQNLIELTDSVADNYDSYGDGFDATKIAREFENDLLKQVILELEEKKLALDLGCANGESTKLISGHGFNEVIGYDISPKMLEVANNRNNNDNISYEQSDLFNGIPKDNNSVDLVVSNFGTASQISENIIPEVNRVLTKGGKAFLSFYNKNSIMNDWWQPWQSSIEAVLNVEDDILEVPVIKGNTHKTYKVYSKSMSNSDIENELIGTDLVIENIYSHSMLTAMMPPMFFDDEKRKNHIEDFEKNHSDKKPYLGFYLTVVLRKN